MVWRWRGLHKVIEKIVIRVHVCNLFPRLALNLEQFQRETGTDRRYTAWYATCARLYARSALAYYLLACLASWNEPSLFPRLCSSLSSTDLPARENLGHGFEKRVEDFLSFPREIWLRFEIYIFARERMLLERGVEILPSMITNSDQWWRRGHLWEKNFLEGSVDDNGYFIRSNI